MTTTSHLVMHTSENCYTTTRTNSNEWSIPHMPWSNSRIMHMNARAREVHHCYAAPSGYWWELLHNFKKKAQINGVYPFGIVEQQVNAKSRRGALLLRSPNWLWSITVVVKPLLSLFNFWSFLDFIDSDFETKKTQYQDFDINGSVEDRFLSSL